MQALSSSQINLFNEGSEGCSSCCYRTPECIIDIAGLAIINDGSVPTTKKIRALAVLSRVQYHFQNAKKAQKTLDKSEKKAL